MNDTHPISTYQIERLAQMVAKIPKLYRATYKEWTLKRYLKLELGSICDDIALDFDWDRWNELCERS